MAIVLKVALPKIPLYKFGAGVADGDSDMKVLLGGKGANLAGMSKLGIPVPAGFTIPTTSCIAWQACVGSNAKKGAFTEGMRRALAKGMEHIGNRLVSVRSGARVSMPGMMDTILNVGITDQNLGYWEDRLGTRTARDSYRRFLQM